MNGTRDIILNCLSVNTWCDKDGIAIFDAHVFVRFRPRLFRIALGMIFTDPKSASSTSMTHAKRQSLTNANGIVYLGRMPITSIIFWCKWGIHNLAR
jgi:hypothetical protein